MHTDTDTRTRYTNSELTNRFLMTEPSLKFYCYFMLYRSI